MKHPLSHILAAAAMVPVLTSFAYAEEVWTKETTALLKAPEAKDKPLASIDANQKLEVLESQGRWMKVTYQGKTGWVRRLHVRTSAPPGSGGEDGAATEACKDRSSWCGEHGSGGGMRVVVEVDEVQVFKQPTSQSEQVSTLYKGDQLIVMGRRGDSWLLVESADGESGWVPVTAVRDKGNFINPREAPPGAGEQVRDEDEDLIPKEPKRTAAVSSPRRDGNVDGGSVAASRQGGQAQSGKLAVSASVGAGLAALSNELNGAQGGGYRASATGPAVRLLAGGSYALAPNLSVGGDLTLNFMSGSFAYTAGGADEDIGFTVTRTLVAAKVGYVSSFAAFARVGFYFDLFSVGDLDNAASLPKESFASPALGVEVWLPPFVQNLSLGARADFMLIATSRSQTAGLEDGDSVDSASAIGALLQASYRLTPRIWVDGAYQLSRASTAWSGASVRDAMVTDGKRTDLLHFFTLGVGASIF